MSNSLLGSLLGWLRGPEPQARPQPQPYQPPPIQPYHSAPANPRPAPNASPAPQTQRRSPYGKIDRLLTISEGDFYAVLRQVVPPGYLLFAQVRLAGLVRVQSWAQRDKTHWYKIQAKCVDFVLCDERTFAPRLVVELDDASHDREDRQARDAFVDEVLAEVGLPILHVRWQRSYSQAALARQVLAALGGRAGEVTSPEQLSRPGSAVPGQVTSPEQLWRPGSAAPGQVTSPEQLWRPGSAAPGQVTSPEQLWRPIPAAPAPVAVSQQAQATVAEQRRLCGQCDAELRPGAKFCSQCGATFSRAS